MTRRKQIGFLVFAVIVLAVEAYYLRGGILKTLDPVVWRLSNILYYQDGQHTWDNTTWLGVPLEKYPTDLFIYQEIISETKPVAES